MWTVKNKNKYIVKYCASRWSFTKNRYMMHGQQNVKFCQCEVRTFMLYSFRNSRRDAKGNTIETISTVCDQCTQQQEDRMGSVFIYSGITFPFVIYYATERDATLFV
jgi:hypothetical protein